MRTAPGPALVLAAAGLLVGATLFFSGGSSVERLFPLGTAALLLAAAVGVAVLTGALPRPILGRAGAAFVVLLAAFVAWSGVSVQWSIAPDASWNSFNRNLVYLAFALLGVLAGALAPRRLLAAGLAVLLAAVVAWALLGKVIPSLFPGGERRARLREPVDYWNALALLCVIAVVLGLWLASTRTFRPAVRAVGVLLVYAAAVAAVLTYSRAGIAIAVLGALAWVLLSGAAFDAVVALLLSMPAAAGAAAFAVTLPGVAHDAQAHATRVHDGRLFGVVLGSVALGVFGLALAVVARPPPSERTQRGLVRALLGAAALGALVLVSALVWRGGGPGTWLESQWDEFRTSDAVAVSEDPARLGALDANNRWLWWQEAWRGFLDEPLTGHGAGTFFLVHLHERERPVSVSEPHNVPLQFLTDTGVVGFLLIGGALLAAGVAAVGTLRRLRGVERGAALALAVASSAYLAHWLVDFDWDFVAVTGPALLMVGALVPQGAAAGVRRPLWAVGTAALALVACSSLLVPWLAERRLDDAYAALSRGAPAAAAADAEEAHRLNPLAVEPLLVWGLAEEASENRREAYRRYRQAVELQPENPNTWFALGAFELQSLRRPQLAHGHLVRAHELDPFGAEGDLDRLIGEAQRAVERQRRLRP